MSGISRIFSESTKAGGRVKQDALSRGTSRFGAVPGDLRASLPMTGGPGGPNAGPANGLARDPSRPVEHPDVVPDLDHRLGSVRLPARGVHRPPARTGKRAAARNRLTVSVMPERILRFSASPLSYRFLRILR